MRPGLERLAEDHVAPRVVQGAPVAYPPLQRPPDTIVRKGVRIGHLQMAQKHNLLNGAVTLEDRQQTGSHTAASGSGTVRPRGLRCDGRRGSASSRRPVRSLNPAWAAAVR
jgi:hypothetical protein